MVATLGWHEIALRLSLTLAAGGLIGINRGERGRPAGLRTTLLVCLAASVAMIQANLLLSTTGKSSDSFVVFDPMRLPLGILSGIGFIGAGAILRRDDLVLGVTTAATLWFVTVIGLCFGGGQLALGVAALALALIVLWCLKWAERRMRQDRRATLSLAVGAAGPSEDEVRAFLFAKGFRIVSQSAAYAVAARQRKLLWEVEWHGHANDARLPGFLDDLARRSDVAELEWKEARQ
jgi:putative Mg2+ transporter-C (MgtC) family protein